MERLSGLALFLTVTQTKGGFPQSAAHVVSPPPFIVNAYFSPVILLPIHHQPLYFFPPTTPLFSFPSAFTQWGLSL